MTFSWSRSGAGRSSTTFRFARRCQLFLTVSSESEIIPGRTGEPGEKTLNIIREIDRNTMRMDLAPFQVRFYLTRLTGEDDFGSGMLAGGFALARITGGPIPCP